MKTFLGVMAGAFLVTGVPAAAQAPAEVFFRLTAPLDEPRGLCLDIPGHKDRVRTDAPLVVHSCKRGIWNHDERFAAAPLRDGTLRMPAYGLCVGARAARDGAKLVLGACDGSTLRRWRMSGGSVRLAADPALCMTVGPEPSELTPGGRRLPSRHVARSVGLAACDAAAAERQRWQQAPITH